MMISGAALASTLTEPNVGVGVGRGCEGAINDGAGREDVIAATAVAETPAERYRSLTAVRLTGALTLKGSHRTVGSFLLRVRVAACLSSLSTDDKKVVLGEVRDEDGGMQKRANAARRRRVSMAFAIASLMASTLTEPNVG